MAKVIQLCPDRDGIARLAKVQIQNVDFLSPVQRLFPLEVYNSSYADDEHNSQIKAVPNETVSSPTEHPCASPVAPTTRVFTRNGHEVKLRTRF